MTPKDCGLQDVGGAVHRDPFDITWLEKVDSSAEYADW